MGKQGNVPYSFLEPQMNSAVLTGLPLISACSEDVEPTENPDIDSWNESGNRTVWSTALCLLAQMIITALKQPELWLITHQLQAASPYLELSDQISV